MDPRDFARQLETLAVLDEPVRRKLYLYVAGQADDVGRDEAARATKVSRALAAFHLDKLVEAGLLEASFRRLSGRAGPGAGRPAKLYRRASVQLDVSVPQRRYEMAAHILARALAELPADESRALLREAARDWGGRMAAEPTVAKRSGLPLQRAKHALAACGFEPHRTRAGELVLGNCPFHSLAAERRELVCGMNQALIEGLLAGLDLPGVEARLAPQATGCCVALRSTDLVGGP
jgi:predicted ArsR family transcriptional regulator